MYRNAGGIIAAPTLSPLNKKRTFDETHYNYVNYIKLYIYILRVEDKTLISKHECHKLNI